MFGVGSFYPNVTKEHGERITRYRENKQIFKGEHYEILEKYNDVIPTHQQRTLYVTTNLAGLICKKSADFLFGENAYYSAGMKDDSKEQEKMDEWVRENDIHITNYESALANSYRGDSFYKVRWGQEHGGLLTKELDPFRVIIEAQNAEFVFPETYPNDSTRIKSFHIAIPEEVRGTHGDEWLLNVETHCPNKITYRQFRMNPIEENVDGIQSWRIYAEVGQPREVETGVPMPLVIHVPNYATDDCWTGIDDLSELKGLFSELNTRISQIGEILAKHADPAMIVPQGTLVEDENGQPEYRVGVDKVFEVMNGEMEPKYLTWNGQLEYAFREVDKILELILIKAEIPAVAVGLGESGTSGNSGLAIKWRMNSLLSKINRKRQYYDKALKRIFKIAQMLEMDRKGGKVDFKPFLPHIKFQDGLPEDEMEKASIMQIRTGAKPTISQKRAIMEIENISDEQAQQILDEIEDEELINAVDPNAFQVEANEEPEVEEIEIDEEE